MTERFPLQITFRGMEHSDALEQRIEERVDRLSRTGERILGCKVSVEATRTHDRGFSFNVHARVQTRRGEVVVSHDADPTGAHEDAYVAVRDAMDALHRQLVDGRKKRQTTSTRVVV